MPHSVYTRDLGRSVSWRKATVRSLAQALLTHERITTTWSRAKAAQRFVERLISLGKSGTLADRRRAISRLGDPSLVRRLFSEVAPRFTARSGGYTRILRSGIRNGDGASMAVLELVVVARPEKKLEAPAKVKPRKEEAPGPEPVEPPKPKPKLETKPKPEAKPKSEGKPRGFLGNLRKFFKGRREP
ncbi:MAG: 50S ribosomal protein L17 [Candidatus Omnitrophica bacterium]|nr:50S ribosomal protein L17 [Candidatus Omnitrophota bacterium]